MPDRFLVSAVGAIVEIDVSSRDADFRVLAFDAWADARYEGKRVPAASVAVREDLAAAAALSMLSTDVTVAALAHRRTDPLWMLHAAGLADENGRVVILSAPSGTGKTTAARYLSRRYAYVSDETVGIEDNGGVVPYRKPLSVIEPPSAHKAQVALSTLDGGLPLPSALRVAKIVVLDRSPDGPAEPLLEHLDIAEALELLGPQTSYLCDAEAPLHRIAALLDATGGAVRLRYREVDTIDGLIDQALSEPERPVAPVVPRLFEPVSDWTHRPGTLARAEVVDQLDLDGRTVLLRRTESGGHVQVLDGIGPALWASANGSTLDELVGAVVAVHGEPEGADAYSIVESAVRQLIADGFLRVSAPQS